MAEHDQHARHNHHHAAGHGANGDAVTAHGAHADMPVKDPVCGMTVDPATAKHQTEHRGHQHYFCSAGCKTKFDADPDRYVSTASSRAEPPIAPPGTVYTCPMHPEIRRDAPGSCPICGMALEPMMATADEGPSPELVDMTRRFWIGLVLALPVFLLEMGGHLFPADRKSVV